MFAMYEKIYEVLQTWFTSIRGNNIPISEPLLPEKLANLLTHLIATLSTHQTDGLEDGKKGTSRLLLYAFLHLKIHNKESGLHSKKYCQWLISKASHTNNLLNVMYQFFSQPLSFTWKIRSKNRRPSNSKTHVIRTNVIVPWEFELHDLYLYVTNWI